MSKIVVVRRNDLILAIEYSDGNPVSISISRETDITLGSVYVGRVTNVKKDLDAVFVEFCKDIVGFLPYEELKQDVKQGNLLPVMVVKEPVKTKGYTLSQYIELTGEYCVVSDKGNDIHASSKLKKDVSAELVSRLSSEDFCETGFGGIIRTKASVEEYDKLKAEYSRLCKLMSDISAFGNTRTAFTCLYKEKPAYIKSLLTKNDNDLECIITDDKYIFSEVDSILSGKTQFHDNEKISLSALYRVEHAISLATDKKVNLPCGGYLIIEPTEALTVIDVNSGKFSLKKNKSEMIRRVNKEAAKEVAFQLSFRNISGMILVDFINFDCREDEEELISYLNSLLKYDKCKTKVHGFTKLKILEITRQKINASVYDFL